MHFTFDERVLVGGGGSGQHPQLGPNLVDTLLLHLSVDQTETKGLRFGSWALQRLGLWPFSVPHLSFLVADPPVELFAVDAEEIFSRVDDAALDGDGPSRVDVVACDHSHRDSRALTLLDGVGHLDRDAKRSENLITGKN